MTLLPRSLWIFGILLGLLHANRKNQFLLLEISSFCYLLPYHQGNFRLDICLCFFKILIPAVSVARGCYKCCWKSINSNHIITVRQLVIHIPAGNSKYFEFWNLFWPSKITASVPTQFLFWNGCKTTFSVLEQICSEICSSTDCKNTLIPDRSPKLHFVLPRAYI